MSLVPWIRDEEGDHNEHYLKLPNDDVVRIYSDRDGEQWSCYTETGRKTEHWDHNLDAKTLRAAQQEALQWALEE